MDILNILDFFDEFMSALSIVLLPILIIIRILFMEFIMILLFQNLRKADFLRVEKHFIVKSIRFRYQKLTAFHCQGGRYDENS